MSIQSEIDRLKGNVAAAYAAVMEKGGEIPSATSGQRSSANLAAAIRGIPTGIALESITIVTPPEKTVYSRIESFDPTGMTVRATYTNGATKEITDYTCAPCGMIPLGVTAVTISYTEQGVTKTAEQPVVTISISEKKPLNDMTWAEIREISDAGVGAEYFSVGDRKAVALKGTVGSITLDTTLYVYILGFDHNAALEGSGISFGAFKTALTGGTDVCLVDGYHGSSKTGSKQYFNMGHWAGGNYGGWAACALRYDILGSTNIAPAGYGKAPTAGSAGYDALPSTTSDPVENTLMAALPSDLRAVMKPITKYTDNTGARSNSAESVNATVDYLPLLAEFEISGRRSSANPYEQNAQSQYDYYKAGNSIKKYRHSSTSTVANWWMRSPYYNTVNDFCCVDGNYTAVSSYQASYSYGLAPVFLV